MAIKVHGHPVSSAAQRVLLCLAEKDIVYEFVLVDLRIGEQKKEPFISINVSILLLIQTLILQLVSESLLI